MSQKAEGAARKPRIRRCWACGGGFTESASRIICSDCITRPAAFMAVPAADLAELRAA